MIFKIELDSFQCYNTVKKYYKDSRCKNNKYMQIKNILLRRSNVTFWLKLTKKIIQEGPPKKWQMIGRDRIGLHLEKPVKDTWLLTTPAKRDSYHLKEEKEIMKNICTPRFSKMRWAKVPTTGSTNNPTPINLPYKHNHHHPPRKNRYTSQTPTVTNTTTIPIEIYHQTKLMEISIKNHIIILITLNREINIVIFKFMIKVDKVIDMNLNLLLQEILINIKKGFTNVSFKGAPLFISGNQNSRGGPLGQKDTYL